MRTVEIPARSRGVNNLLRQALDENIIVKSQDGREFVLAAIDDFDQEIELTRKNKEIMEYLDQCGCPTRTYTLDEARKRLGIAKKKRKMNSLSG